MEGYKIAKDTIIHDFSKDKKRALRILEDEKKTREALRKKANLKIQSKNLDNINEIIKKAEVA